MGSLRGPQNPLNRGTEGFGRYGAKHYEARLKEGEMPVGRLKRDAGRCEWCGEPCGGSCRVVHPWRRYHHSGPISEETWVVCHGCEEDLARHLKETIEYGLPTAGRYSVWAVLVLLGPALVVYGLFNILGLGVPIFFGLGLPLGLGVTGLLSWKLLNPHPIWVNMGKPSRMLFSAPLKNAVAVSRGLALVMGIGFPLIALITALLQALSS